MSEVFGKIAQSLIAGKIDEVAIITKKALNSGSTAKDILNQGLMAGMGVVGQRFKANEIYMPEVFVSAKWMHIAMAILKPLLIETGLASVAKLVIGTVKGDLHDIGKNLVGMMFEGAGLDVVDIGINVEPQKFIDIIKEQEPDLLGISALLTTTMPNMGETIKAIKEAGIRDQIKILVGGPPLNVRFAKEIGADAYASNASTAVDKGKELLGL